MWTGTLLIVMVVLDLSAWVQYITRFTEESFALLISLIFIKEAFAKLASVTLSHPIHFPIETRPGWCQGICRPPLVNESTATNITNATSAAVSSSTLPTTTVNVTEITTPEINMTAFWANKTLEDCVLTGGHWDKLYDCHDDTEPEVFFLSVILFLGTFTISMTLKGMRTSKFFPTQVSCSFSDLLIKFIRVSILTVIFLFVIQNVNLLLCFTVI